MRWERNKTLNERDNPIRLAQDPRKRQQKLPQRAKKTYKRCRESPLTRLRIAHIEDYVYANKFIEKINPK